MPVQNPDLWWHLSAGRWMLEHRALPRADFLSWTRAGAPWVDFEWLTQVLYWLAWRAGGGPALLALRVAALGGVLGLGAWLVRLYGWGPAAQGLAALLLGVALYPLADLRPDNVSLLFFTGLLVALEARRLDLLKPRPAHWLAAAACFALWANLHLAFLYGLLLVAFYIAGDLADAYRPVISGTGRRGRLDRAADYFGLLALGGAATLLNPYSGQLYGVLTEHYAALRFLRDSICEWQMPDVTMPSFSGYWVVVIFSFGAALAHFVKTRATPLGLLGALLYFGLSSSSHQRHLSYLALTGVPFAFWAARDLGWTGRRAAWAGAVLAALSLARVADLAMMSVLVPGTPFVLEQHKSAADLLVREAAVLSRLRMYNGWGEGGYFGFRLTPEYKIFFDGRYIFHDLLFETRPALEKPERFEPFLDARGVDLVIFRRAPGSAFPETVKAKTKAVVPRPLYLRYLPPARWAYVHWDARDIVAVRRAAVSKEWLASRELRWLWADDWLRLDHQLREGAIEPAAVYAELKRVEAAAPDLKGFLKPLEDHLLLQPR